MFSNTHSTDLTLHHPYTNQFPESFSDHDHPDRRSLTPSAPDLSSFLALYPNVSAAPAAQNPDEDLSGASSLFNFFYTELSHLLPYVDLFPWTAATLFSTSNINPTLQHCVKAVEALSGQTSEAEMVAWNHLQEALRYLRKQLDSGADDTAAINSFFLAHICMMLGDHMIARQHIGGMLSIIYASHLGSGPSPDTTDKLTVLIWRMAIRIDFISSVMSGKEPILPM
jgi:hypothetical protein